MRPRPAERNVRRRLIWLVAASATLLLLSRAGAALVVSAPVEKPDVIVLLASHEWERLPAAAAWARQNPRARVILTVPTAPTYWNCFRCSERAAWLAKEGVDPSHIVELTGVRNTWDEANAVAAYVRAERLNRALIVTSPYHTRRAAATFGKLTADSGVSLGVVPTDRSNATPGVWWWYDVDRAYVVYEWTAIAWYAVRYGVRPF
jgi:uncharacterized SAM-binding protein YcdF (DUF218 family)